MRVIAKKSFEYQGKVISAGDEVSVPAPLGRAWQMMQRADIKAEEAPSVPIGDDETPRKRQYRRRDMRVED